MNHYKQQRFQRLFF